MRKVRPLSPHHLFGVGLRSPHYLEILNITQPQVGWFEIIAENYFRTKGRPREILNKIRSDYALSVHGVSLSIASYDEIDWKYLSDLKNFYSEMEPFIISDHLCFTGSGGKNIHNLLPFAYNKENLHHISDRIDRVQNFLGRQMAFENLSAYFDYNHSSMSEWDFIKELCSKVDCHILLDLNNVIVNAYNHQFDAKSYVDAIDFNRVKEIHTAGYSEREGFYFDTHSNPLYPEIIELFKYIIPKAKNIPVLFEWDENIPSFEMLKQQADKLKAIAEQFSL